MEQDTYYFCWKKLKELCEQEGDLTINTAKLDSMERKISILVESQNLAMLI